MVFLFISRVGFTALSWRLEFVFWSMSDLAASVGFIGLSLVRFGRGEILVGSCIGYLCVCYLMGVGSCLTVCFGVSLFITDFSLRSGSWLALLSVCGVGGVVTADLGRWKFASKDKSLLFGV